jgi:hypothetical protein
MDTGKTPKGNGNDTATPENTVMSSEDNHIFGENKEEEKNMYEFGDISVFHEPM